jgi:hypothetical protein
VEAEDHVDDSGGVLEVVVVPSRLRVPGDEIVEDGDAVTSVRAGGVERGIPAVVRCVHAGSLAATPTGCADGVGDARLWACWFRTCVNGAGSRLPTTRITICGPAASGSGR